jgi:hypothetical protein
MYSFERWNIEYLRRRKRPRRYKNLSRLKYLKYYVNPQWVTYSVALKANPEQVLKRLNRKAQRAVNYINLNVD